MRRSYLYVPAVDERKVLKAPGLKADVIVYDLEDAVPLDRKDEARALLRRILEDSSYTSMLKDLKGICVRINSSSTLEFFKDIVLVSKLDPITCIVVPKAGEDLSFVYKATGRNVIALIETARGFTNIEDIASSEGMEALMLGTADLALDVGGALKAYESNVYVRTALVLNAKAYGLDAVDKMYFNIEDLEGLRREALEAKALGYTGKSVIHPSQIAVVNEVFKPTQEELEWARRVVEAYEKALKEGRGAIRFEGELIDYPHYRVAKRILEATSES